MAEGTDPGAETVAEEVSIRSEDTLPPAVRPKERAPEVGADNGDAGEADTQLSTAPPLSGTEWRSPSLESSGERGSTFSSSAEPFRRWRERRWMEDEEGGEWTYSTGLGSSTLDILREKFGESSFRDAAAWQPWVEGAEARPPPRSDSEASGPTRFHLASPKLKLKSAEERPHQPERPRLTAHSQTGRGDMNSTEGQGEGRTSTLLTRDSRRPPDSGRSMMGQHRMNQPFPSQPSMVAPAQVGGPWQPQPMWGPPPLQASFDGSSDRVAIFLSQVISYFDLYGQFYPTQWSMVVAVTTVLKGEAADWVADLHSDHARELTDVGLFLEGLRARFEDDTRVQQVEGELVALRQRGRPAREYVKEFRAVAGRLRAWPERMLVHQFQLGLDREIRQACVYQGLPPRLSQWFKAAIELDQDLKEFFF